jgi:deazaflavin-dependent oxidoreductase (nitroreductase family)
MVTAAWVISFLAILLVPILLVRFRKRQLAAFHRAITNRIARPFAARLPGFGIVTNAGRKSGKLYRTPVNVFRMPDGFRIALTYGRESGWVRNVLASGVCQLETRGVSYQLSTPVMVHDPSKRRFPLIIRTILGLIDANDFLELTLTCAAQVVSEHESRGAPQSSKP